MNHAPAAQRAARSIALIAAALLSLCVCLLALPATAHAARTYGQLCEKYESNGNPYALDDSDPYGGNVFGAYQMSSGNAVKYAHEYIGDLKHGANALIDWNLYLDQIGGPNHVANYCNAPVMCDVDAGTVQPLPSYAFIRALGQAIQPGATRVETSAYTAALDTVAFRNPDGTLAVVLLNRGHKALPVTLRVGNDTTACTVDAGSIATVIIA